MLQFIYRCDLYDTICMQLPWRPNVELQAILCGRVQNSNPPLTDNAGIALHGIEFGSFESLLSIVYGVKLPICICVKLWNALVYDFGALIFMLVSIQCNVDQLDIADFIFT